MINWLVRFKNKGFWLCFIPAVLLFVQTAVALFGLNIELEGLAAKLLDVMNALFAVLALLGIVNDPTTEGVGDSAQALGYTEPKRAG